MNRTLLRNMLVVAFGLGIVAAGGNAPVRAQAIVNGGFETGTLSGWTQAGRFSNTYSLSSISPDNAPPDYSSYQQAVSLTSSATATNAAETQQTASFDSFGTPGPAVNPVEGSYLAFVATQSSAGDGSLTLSSLSQSFNVTASMAGVSMSARFLSNDDPSTVSLYGNNDFGGLALVVGGVAVQQVNFDLDPTSGANVHVTAGANVGGFQNSTGWQFVNFTLGSYVGQNVTLVAYAVNLGDNFGESRLLLDGVAITSVPEPSTLALGGLAAVALGLVGYRNARRRDRGNA